MSSYHKCAVLRPALQNKFLVSSWRQKDVAGKSWSDVGNKFHSVGPDTEKLQNSEVIPFERKKV